MGIYTKLLLHGEGADASTTILDSEAGTKKTVTAVGNAQIDTAQYKFNTGSILFDGINSYLTIPDSDDWYFGSGDFTIEFQVRVANLPTSGNLDTIVSQYQDINNAWTIYLYNNSGTITWYFNQMVGGSTNIQQLFATSGVSTNTWYHVAMVRSGNSWYCFQDGVQQGSTGTETDPISDNSGLLKIGFSDGGYFDGWIDEFRVSKGIARWTSNFTPPTSAYASEELVFNETITASESYGESIGNIKSLLETITLTDLIVYATGKGRNFNETILLTDLLSMNINKNILDTTTLSDAISKNIIKFPFTETITLTDIINIAIERDKKILDTIELSEIFIKIASFNKSYTDTITLTDLFEMGINKLFCEQITMSDTLSRRLSLSRTFTETISMIDTDFTLSGGEESIVDISKNPQISVGSEQGELLTIHHISDSPKLRIVDGRGVSLMGGKAYTMGSGDVLSLVYQTDNSVWQETSRGKYL